MEPVKCTRCHCLIDSGDADRFFGKYYCGRCSPVAGGARSHDGRRATSKEDRKVQFDQIVEVVGSKPLLRAFFAIARYVHVVAFVLLFVPGLLLFFLGSLIGILLGSVFAGIKIFLKGRLGEFATETMSSLATAVSHRE